jgi:hypothetical protein
MEIGMETPLKVKIEVPYDITQVYTQSNQSQYKIEIPTYAYLL